MPIIDFRWWKICDQTEAIKQNGVQSSGAEQKLSKWCNGNLSSIGLNTLGMMQCVIIVLLVLRNYIFFLFCLIHHEWYIFQLIYLCFLWTRLRWNYISFGTQMEIVDDEDWMRIFYSFYLFLADCCISFTPGLHMTLQARWCQQAPLLSCWWPENHSAYKSVYPNSESVAQFRMWTQSQICAFRCMQWMNVHIFKPYTV